MSRKPHVEKEETNNKSVCFFKKRQNLGQIDIHIKITRFFLLLLCVVFRIFVKDFVVVVVVHTLLASWLEMFGWAVLPQLRRAVCCHYKWYVNFVALLMI